MEDGRVERQMEAVSKANPDWAPAALATARDRAAHGDLETDVTDCDVAAAVGIAEMLLGLGTDRPGPEPH
jgi:hypothetical protein